MAEVLGMMRLATRIKSGRASTGHDTPTWKKSGRLTAMKIRNRGLAAVKPGAHELGEENSRRARKEPPSG